MPTGALLSADVRVVTIIAVFSLLMGTAAALAAGPQLGVTETTVPAAASVKAGQPRDSQTLTSPAPIREWGTYLDVAFELTYWDKSEIKEWRGKSAREIGKPLAAFIAAWQGKLAASIDNTGAVQEGDRQPIYQDRDYLRLAIAQTVDYLQNENRDSLDGAEKTLVMLKDKGMMPETAFWFGYIKALQALENNDSAQFVSCVFDIWNYSVLYNEQGEMAGKAAKTTNGTVTSFYYRNVVNLVVNRAIINHKLADLNALGPIFLMLRERDFGGDTGEEEYFATLVRRIAEGMVAPDSDRYRLNFTVAAIESRRLQQVAAAKLDAEGMSEEARKVFEQSRIFNDYAIKWASSPRSSGVVMEVTDYLDSASFAIQRLAVNEKAPAYSFFKTLPAQDGLTALLKAMAVFNDIAVYSEGGWEKAGYADREVYVKASHRLWRSIMELALWTGDFYLTKLYTAVDQQSVFNLAAPMQVALDSYLDFLAAQESRRYPVVIPDSAFFGAAEAADKLAYANLRVHAYSTDITAYNLWLLHRLQATELFPLDLREITQTAAILRKDGRYILFLDYFLPLAGRFKQSPAVKRWLEEQKFDTALVIREYVNSIYDLLAATSGEAKGTVSTSFVETFRKLQEELQRKPDHPVHKLLRSFYEEEMQKATPYTLLLKNPSRLNQGL